MPSRYTAIRAGFMAVALIATAGLAMPEPVQAAPAPDGGSNRCAPANPLPEGAVVPEPFLKLPLREQDAKNAVVVTQGWVISVDEAEIIGNGLHRALDLEFPGRRDQGHGLPIVAAADGRAYFTYQNLTETWVDPQGVSHRIGVGGGLFVEVMHTNGFTTQYIHLATVADGIPYVGASPDPTVPGDWIPTGLFQPRQVLWDLAKPVRAGEVIGTLGDTGIGLDWNDNFDPVTGQVAPRDRVALPPWDPPQLHFQPFGGRDQTTFAKQNVLDPSGGYWQIGTERHNQYTPRPGKFCLGEHALWLTDRHGRPLYAA